MKRKDNGQKASNYVESYIAALVLRKTFYKTLAKKIYVDVGTYINIDVPRYTCITLKCINKETYGII